MTSRFALPAWSDFADYNDDQVPLLGSVLLIAHDEYPGLDAGACEARIVEHVRALESEVARLDTPTLRIQAINRHLFEEWGYAGDDAEYYDPRNSYLNQVLERRLGNPISLAVIQLEVSRRLGVPLDGVSFPGHFLVRLPVEGGLLVMDPYNRGRPLDVDELRRRARPHFGAEVPDDALLQVLGPASPRTILTRILRNLHAGYTESEDWARAVRCMDRLLHVSPEAFDALRDRGLGYLAMGHVAGARADLTRYLQEQPDADDAPALRERLIDTRSPGRLH